MTLLGRLSVRHRRRRQCRFTSYGWRRTDIRPRLQVAMAAHTRPKVGATRGMRAVAAVAELHRAEGYRINVTSSHPALVRHCERSPLWRLVQIRKSGRPRRCAFLPKYRSAVGRTVVSFEYVGAGDWGLGLR